LESGLNFFGGHAEYNFTCVEVLFQKEEPFNQQSDYFTR